MSATNPRPMIHKYLHFARHSLTTHLHHPSTATLLAFIVARHLSSEPSGDNFALFRRPTPLAGALRQQFCPFSLPDTSHLSPQATILPFFVAQHLSSEPSGTILPFFVAGHLASEPSGDTFAPFRCPALPVGALRQHFCPFSLPDT